VAAVNKICIDAKDANPAVGMFTPTVDELPGWRKLGASLFLLSSDQSMLLAGANELAESIRG
jgi:2-keto-3-deoxy-L-rhamnonate aldolase RhmA